MRLGGFDQARQIMRDPNAAGCLKSESVTHVDSGTLGSAPVDTRELDAVFLQ